jgi:hypothetical protein
LRDVHESDDFSHALSLDSSREAKKKKQKIQKPNEREEKKFRPCHGKIMKSDLFYCSMLLTLYSIANLLLFSRARNAMMMIFTIPAIVGKETMKHCLSKRKNE